MISASCTSRAFAWPLTSNGYAMVIHMTTMPLCSVLWRALRMSPQASRTTPIGPSALKTSTSPSPWTSTSTVAKVRTIAFVLNAAQLLKSEQQLASPRLNIGAKVMKCIPGLKIISALVLKACVCVFSQSPVSPESSSTVAPCAGCRTSGPHGPACPGPSAEASSSTASDPSAGSSASTTNRCPIQHLFHSYRWHICFCHTTP